MKPPSLCRSARFKRTGRRRVIEISEIKGLNNDGQYIVESIYKLEGDGHSNPDGALLWTGVVPSLAADAVEELQGAERPEWVPPRCIQLEKRSKPASTGRYPFQRSLPYG
ncbi:hypothetical protein GCM10007919_03920 [Rhizobium indigoferae]|nr:hypothetical protein GCM10007919_03920 [Rhizobium indigoferae]